MTPLKWFSVAGYVIMVIALVALIYLGGLFSTSIPVIVIQVLSASLMVWARITFGSRSFHYAANATKGGLVTTGPYRYVRHPIYASIIYFAVAGVAGNWSLTNALLAGVVCAGAAIRIFCEERLIVVEYPEYTEYASRTRRVLPFIL
ncbi:MAG TPA: isoprenylcysteine carboxylmethyltransferase family protein [Bacteroidota bacterium]